MYIVNDFGSIWLGTNCSNGGTHDLLEKLVITMKITNDKHRAAGLEMIISLQHRHYNRSVMLNLIIKIMIMEAGLEIRPLTRRV